MQSKHPHEHGIATFNCQLHENNDAVKCGHFTHDTKLYDIFKTFCYHHATILHLFISSNLCLALHDPIYLYTVQVCKDGF